MGGNNISGNLMPRPTSMKRPLSQASKNDSRAKSKESSDSLTQESYSNSNNNNNTSKSCDGAKRHRSNSPIQYQLRKPTGSSENEILDQSAQPSSNASPSRENNINEEALEQQNTINGDLYSQLRTKITEYNNNQGQRPSSQSPNSFTQTNPYVSLLASLKEETLQISSQEYSFSTLARLVNKFSESQPDVAELYFSLAAITEIENKNPNKIKKTYKNAASVLQSYGDETKTIDSMCSLLPKDLERCIQERNRIFTQRDESMQYYKNICHELGILEHEQNLLGFKDGNEKEIFKKFIEAETTGNQHNKRHSSFFPNLKFIKDIQNHSCFASFRNACLDKIMLFGIASDIFSENQHEKSNNSIIPNSPDHNDLVLAFRKHVFQHKLKEEERQVYNFKSTYKQDVIQLVNDSLHEKESPVSSLEDLYDRVTNDSNFSYHVSKTKKYFAGKILDHIHNHGTKIFYFAQSTSTETPVTRSSLNTHYTSLRIDQCDDKNYKVIYMDSLSGNATEWAVNKKTLRSILKNISEIYYSPEEFLSNRTIPSDKDLTNLILNGVHESIINTNHVNSEELKQDGTKCGSQSVLNALRFNFDKALKAQELEKTSNLNDTSHIEDKGSSHSITDLDRHRAISYVRIASRCSSSANDRVKYELINVIFDNSNEEPLIGRLMRLYNSVRNKIDYNRSQFLMPINLNFFLFPENCRDALCEFVYLVSGKLYRYGPMTAASLDNQNSILKAFSKNQSAEHELNKQLSILRTARVLLEYKEYRLQRRKNVILPNGKHASNAFLTLAYNIISKLKKTDNVQARKILNSILTNKPLPKNADHSLDTLYALNNNETLSDLPWTSIQKIVRMYIMLSSENTLESSLLNKHGSLIKAISKHHTDRIDKIKTSFVYNLIYCAKNFSDINVMIKKYVYSPQPVKNYTLVIAALFSKIKFNADGLPIPLERNITLLSPFITQLIKTLEPMSATEKKNYLQNKLGS